jgi:hypothetical protein
MAGRNLTHKMAELQELYLSLLRLGRLHRILHLGVVNRPLFADS